MTIHYGKTIIHLSKKGWNDLFLDVSPYTTSVIISDSLVYPLHGEQIKKQLEIPAFSFVFPAGETSKTIQTAEQCWRSMSKNNLDRRSLVIGLGGGVVTDLAGFVAATYMRGIDLIQIPTTLLGMVDASIGGKTGVNLPEGKNLVGAIYQPNHIYISIPLLATLPQREMSSGLAEVIKYGVIADYKLFTYLENNIERIIAHDSDALYHIIERSCEIKADVVSRDEREKGERAILNFGHTFGHALETITNYSEYTHGETVAIGMCCAARLSIKLGLCHAEILPRLENLCERAKLPVKLPQGINIDHFIELMTRDKKAQSRKLNLILVQKFGKVDRFNDIEKQTIKDILKESF